MARAKRDPATVTPAELERARRGLRRSMIAGALSYTVVAALCFAIEEPVVGAVLVAVGVGGLPLSWRWLSGEYDKHENELP